MKLNDTTIGACRGTTRLARSPAASCSPVGKRSIETARLKGALQLLLMSVSWATASTCVAQEPSGQAIFRQRCASCHASGGRNAIGPNLEGVIGRPAGTDDASRYSEALRTSGITWSEETLERFLADPRGLVPGSRMTIAIKDAGQREALVDYLVTLSPSEENMP
jgi:cytochrome c